MLQVLFGDGFISNINKELNKMMDDTRDYFDSNFISYSDNDSYIYELIIPGYSKDNIEMNIINTSPGANQIEIKGKANEKLGLKIVNKEILYTIPLEKDASTSENDIKAELINGVLKIRINKVKNYKNKKVIKIK